MKLPKGVVKHVKRRADGSAATYYYYQPSNIRLPPPDDPEFKAALDAAMRPINNNSPVGTFGALVQTYRRSPGYRDLQPNTIKAYDRALYRVKGWESLKVEAVKRADILAVRDALALSAPQAANQLVQVLSCVFDFAVDRGMREYSPCLKIRRIKGGSHKRWPEAAIQYAMTNFPEHFRRAVVLALFTGQREGDCLQMTWAQYDGSGIEVRQQKTGASLWIPAHKALRAELGRWDRSTTTILTNASGRPWRRGSFGTMFCNLIHAHPEMDGLVFHGLRKAAAARLAEAGCPEREIMAITGHKSAAMVDLYTKEASQKVRAIAAIKKLEDYR